MYGSQTLLFNLILMQLVCIAKYLDMAQKYIRVSDSNNCQIYFETILECLQVLSASSDIL